VILVSSVLGLLLVALGIEVYLGPGILMVSTASMRTHWDFNTFWHSAAALLGGEDIYDTVPEASLRTG
jgi:hypothetical protein